MKRHQANNLIRNATPDLARLVPPSILMDDIYTLIDAAFMEGEKAEMRRAYRQQLRDNAPPPAADANDFYSRSLSERR